ncbi:hypothetical protein FRC08_012313 [Ceratobasidium sp. 394]|nr:hypothetical protein FRC08_012313 [Ceratobasidium sp. 394]
MGMGTRRLLGPLWDADLDRELPGSPLLVARRSVKEKKENTAKKAIIYPHAHFTDRFCLRTRARPGSRVPNVAEPPRESRPATDPLSAASIRARRRHSPSPGIPLRVGRSHGRNHTGVWAPTPDRLCEPPVTTHTSNSPPIRLGGKSDGSPIGPRYVHSRGRTALKNGKRK